MRKRAAEQPSAQPNFLPINPSSKQDLFAGRYELLLETPPGAGGRLFQVRDAQSGEIVALKVFRRELEPEAPERADVERLFALAKGCDHPGILRYHTFALPYLTREWANGFCLVDLLRRRRELPAEELVILLDGVAEAIDAAHAIGLAPRQGIISRLFVTREGSTSQAELNTMRGTPISQWPEFRVKLNPLSLGRILPISWDETLHTMSGDAFSAGGEDAPPVNAFAQAVYELLGAPHRGSGQRRYVPISTLSEGGNTLLRRITTGTHTPESCEAFWNELLREGDLHRPVRKPPAPPAPSVPSTPPAPPAPPVVTVEEPVAPARAPAPPPPPPPPPPRRAVQIPDAFLASLFPATILRLTPRDVSFTPVHLFARASFKIGRSLYHSDFITRVLPETADNEKLTKEIGRVHALLEQSGDTITIRDGNGESASVNGSLLDNAPLKHEQPTPLSSKGVLSLYRNYELEVVPLLGSYDRGCEITNESAWPGPEPTPAPLSGGVVFHPLRNQATLRQAAWIFTRLDFSLNARGGVEWQEAGTHASEASFLHYRGHFWIANFRLPEGALTINRMPIPPGTIVPLVGHQALNLGTGSYVVEVV